MTTFIRNCACVILLSFAAGCSGSPAALRAPDIDATAAGKEAVALYDTNGDAAISATEVVKCPALLYAWRKIDANNDQQLSAEEITARIRTWSARGTALTDFKCTVLLNGRPLPGVEVALEPAPFFGGALQPARGETDDQGLASISIARDKLPDPSISGVCLGLYTVRITSHVNEKLIPAKYNRNSELGQEVTDEPSPLEEGAVEFRLTTS
jgi:hypothetical protein